MAVAGALTIPFLGTSLLPTFKEGELLIRTDAYRALGGYRPVPIMEDVDLVWRIGRSRLVALGPAFVTSAERWRQEGWWRRSARNIACLSLWLVGVPPGRIARLYAGGRPR